MTKSSELVTLVDESRVVEITNKDKLREYLNNNPPSSWIKEHPLAKGVKYLPIDKTETLLDVIFQDWRVEIKSVTQLAQSICAVVRLHYRDPVTGEWTFHDGVGAAPLKTDKGFSAADLSHIKSDAVATGAPAAVAFAIKDAADHIGKIFGRDINRKDTVNLSGIYKNARNEQDYEKERIQQAQEKMHKAKDIAELREVFLNLPNEVRNNAEIIACKNELKRKFAEKKGEIIESPKDQTK